MFLNILYTLHHELLDMTIVSICSLLENNKKNKIKLFFLYDDRFDENKLDQLRKFEQEKNCAGIQFLKVDRQKYSEYSNSHNLLFCLEFSHLVPDGKVLYLLNSTVIDCDLAELYSTDLDGYALAAPEIPYPAFVHVDWRMPKRDFIFAAHVMLLNLDWWRTNVDPETFAQKLPKLKIRKRALSCNEVMNILAGKCLKLPQKYGYCEAGSKSISNFICSWETYQEYNAIRNHQKKPDIIVYYSPSPLSPECQHSYIQRWQHYAKNTVMHLNILYTLHHELLNMTLVSVRSLLENNKKNKIKLFFLYDDRFDETKLNQLKKFEKEKNCAGIQFFKVDRQKYSEYSNSHNLLFCLEFPHLVPDGKVLYLLNSTIVDCDLAELYSTDIKGYALAASEIPYPAFVRVDWRMPKRDFIFAAHVMLLNLDWWRKNVDLKTFAKNLPKLKIRKRVLSCNEVMNILAGRCLKLPQRYGYCEAGSKCISSFVCSWETYKEYNDILNHQEKPDIIVYYAPTPLSPECQHSYKQRWLYYAGKSAITGTCPHLCEEDPQPQTLPSRIKSFFCNIKKTQAYQNYSRILPFVKPYWFRALMSLLICIPIGALDAVIALSLRPYMDLVLVEKTLKSSWFIPCAIVAFTCFQGILNYFATFLNAWVGGKITNDLKFTLYQKMLSFEAGFFDRRKSGDIVFRFNNDADIACNGLLENLKLFISRLCSSISLVAVLFYNSWQLALIAVFVLGGAFLPLANLRKRIKAVMDQTVHATASAITAYNESYAGNKTIIAYNLSERQKSKFKTILDSIFSLKIKIVQRTSWLSPLMHVIVSIGVGLAIGYGSHLILSGQLSPGSFVSFLTALIMLYNPIKTIGNKFNAVQMSFLAIERVFNILEQTPAIQDHPNAKVLNGIEKNISIENVCFEYVKGKPVLKNISLEIQKGETVAFVGNSGGGKSTIVNLIPRFYNLKSGTIKFDGTDIRDFTLKSLRDNIAVVFQDNFLFAGTIRENIMLGSQNASEEELRDALKMAYLEEFVDSLPNGLDTQIGERGVLLSGGQKQRVAIARAFLKNAPIIILDEATSALDNKAEAIVQKAIENLMKDKTVLVIAHRLSTIQQADKIVVISSGKIVEAGTHEELLKIENGQYKTLYDMQFRNK